MTHFRLRLTKTETTISTYETTVDLPTDDVRKAALYAEVACSFSRYDSRNALHVIWHEGEPKIEVACHAEHELEPAIDELPAPQTPQPEAAQ